jgi:hypothetical protein
LLISSSANPTAPSPFKRNPAPPTIMMAKAITAAFCHDPTMPPARIALIGCPAVAGNALPLAEFIPATDIEC